MPDAFPTINAALNLVLPVRWAEETREGASILVPALWAYHTPISRETFDANWRLIGAAHAVLFASRYAMAAGPRLAVNALRQAAADDAAERGLPPTQNAATALLADIRRLTMILAPTPTGFAPVPVEIALAKEIIDADDWAEAEGGLVFFTCGCAMASKARRPAMATALASVLRGSITSDSPTAYAASGLTSTPAETSAAAVDSSATSSTGSPAPAS